LVKKVVLFFCATKDLCNLDQTPYYRDSSRSIRDFQATFVAHITRIYVVQSGLIPT
jgi:hypothetical protein